MNHIRIHPKGTGRITNLKLSRELKEKYPISFKVSKKTLVSVKKYINKTGLFSNDGSRLQKVQRNCYLLLSSVKTEDIENFLKDKSDIEILFYYLSLFSDSYPNWQKEYEALNRLILKFF